MAENFGLPINQTYLRKKLDQIEEEVKQVAPGLSLQIAAIEIAISRNGDSDCLSAIETRLEQVDAKLDTLDKRFDSIIETQAAHGLLLQQIADALIERPAASLTIVLGKPEPKPKPQIVK